MLVTPLLMLPYKFLLLALSLLLAAASVRSLVVKLNKLFIRSKTEDATASSGSC